MSQQSMEFCEGCANPEGGVYIETCKRCMARDLARGPLFFASMRKQKLTPEYRFALEYVFGDGWKEGHELVKAEAKRYATGAAG